MSEVVSRVYTDAQMQNHVHITSAVFSMCPLHSNKVDLRHSYECVAEVIWDWTGSEKREEATGIN